MKTQNTDTAEINELREEAAYFRNRACESMVSIGDCAESQDWAAEADAVEQELKVSLRCAE